MVVGWCDGSVSGVLLIWIIVGQGPTALAVGAGGGSLKEIISQTDLYLVNLSSKTYVFEDKLTKY